MSNPCTEAVGERQHHRRFIVKFCEARGHNAYDAFVPVLVVDHNGFLGRVAFAAAVEDGVGFLGDAFVEFLAVLVILVDGLGNLECLVGVSGHEQLHSFAAALHAA